MDIGSIASLASSLKTAGDITKAMIDLRDTQAVQAKVMIDLNREIMSTQNSALAAYADQATLLEKIRSLESRVADLEAWEREKDRYKLKDFGCSTFAYALKPGMENGEPFHRICANCYQQRRKSILQSHGHYSGREKVTCDGCKAETYHGFFRPRATAPSTENCRPLSAGWRTRIANKNARPFQGNYILDKAGVRL